MMSLTIGIRFLTGYCVTARSRTDPRPEWPPHPARVFMALTAAHFECFEANDATLAALRWLESLGPPEMHLGEDAMANATPPTFVPTNSRDSMARGGTIQTIPSLMRSRAERRFPRTHLPEPQDHIYLVWPAADPGEHRAAIEMLCGAVSRIGHSSSLVQMWLSDGLPTDLELTAWVADDDRPATRLRVAAPGTLRRLEVSFASRPYRPIISTSQGYSRREAAASGVGETCFDPQMDIFQLVPDGSRFRWMQLETTLALTWTLRRAIQERCPVQPPPESISGHKPDGSPSDRPHMAILPLPFVGSDYADGHLLGVAIAVPRRMSQADQQAMAQSLEAIADEADLKGHGLGFDPDRYPGLGQWRLVRQGIFDDHRVNLRIDTWTAAPTGERVWASVTPVALDHHAKAKSKGAYLDECAESIKKAIERVVTGAGEIAVRVTPVSRHAGVPDAGSFSRLKRRDGSERRQHHVIVEFEHPIIGPLIVGAGRYRGYGLFRPWKEVSR